VKKADHFKLKQYVDKPVVGKKTKEEMSTQPIKSIKDVVDTIKQ